MFYLYTSSWQYPLYRSPFRNGQRANRVFAGLNQRELAPSGWMRWTPSRPKLSQLHDIQDQKLADLCISWHQAPVQWTSNVAQYYQRYLDKPAPLSHFLMLSAPLDTANGNESNHFQYRIHVDHGHSHAHSARLRLWISQRQDQLSRLTVLKAVPQTG